MRFNIAIVGGGMVGAALAVSLKNTPLHVALLDAAPAHSPDDSRLIALNDNSVGLLKEVGVWPALAPHAAPIEQIHVSHRGHFAVMRIDCKAFNMAALGYVVPAKYINAALSSALENAPEIKVIRPATVQALTQTAEGVSLGIAAESAALQTLQADVVVGADGSFSTIRTLLGAATEIIDYQQSALVTSTTLQRDHKNVAYERFQAEGAIAMLPLSSHQAATIWTASHEKIRQLMQLPDETFLSELQTCFGYRLGRFLKTDKRAVYPLQMIRVKHPIQQHVVLIGNAAHTFHPIASQGLNLALGEVAHLMKFFQSSPQKVTLQTLRMETGRERFSQFLSHHLTWIFSRHYFMLNTARQIGMLGLDLFPALKKRFALRAMGNYNL